MSLSSQGHWWPGRCFTTLCQLPKGVIEASYFSRMRAIWHMLEQTLCQKFDDGCASMMWRCHQFSDTNHIADLSPWSHHPRIHNLTKTNFESLPSVVKHPQEYQKGSSSDGLIEPYEGNFTTSLVPWNASSPFISILLEVNHMVWYLKKKYAGKWPIISKGHFPK